MPYPYDPQSLNRYAYCLNNPLIYVDPSGHNQEYKDPLLNNWYNSINPEALWLVYYLGQKEYEQELIYSDLENYYAPINECDIAINTYNTYAQAVAQAAIMHAAIGGGDVNIFIGVTGSVSKRYRASDNEYAAKYKRLMDKFDKNQNITVDENLNKNSLESAFLSNQYDAVFF